MKNSISKLVSDNGSALPKKSGAPAGIEKDSMVRSADTKENKITILKVTPVTEELLKDIWSEKVSSSDSANRAPSVVSPLAAVPTAANANCQTAEEVARAGIIHDTVQKIFDVIPASAFLTGEGNKIGKEIEDILIAMHAKKNYNFCSKESILDQLETAKKELSVFLKRMRRGYSPTIPITNNNLEIIEKIEITLKHAAKWIKLNSFSSLPKTDSRNATNPAVSKTGGGEK